MMGAIERVFDRFLELQTHIQNQNHKNDPELDYFLSVTEPVISPIEYLFRIFRYAHVTIPTLIASFITLKSYKIHKLNIHRFVLVSIVVNAKFQQDFHKNNRTMAKIGGVTIEELNFLEKTFLKMIRFELHVGIEDFNYFCRGIV